MPKENEFQASLIKEIKNMFPGCFVMKNDPTYIQGVPDLTILFQDRWAALECKKSKDASHQPNQDYYIDKMGAMSFSRFIYPENKQQVLNDLREYFYPNEFLF